MGQPLSIDPLTDKPKINFVVSSGVVEGEIPADPENEMWTETGQADYRDGWSDHP